MAAIAHAGESAPSATTLSPSDLQSTTLAEETWGDITILDQHNGFRKFSFGSSLRSFKKKMAFVSGKGKWHYFTHPGDSMVLGKAELMAIYYGFYKKKLARVTIITNGDANAHALLDWMQMNYGRGEKPYPEWEKYVWAGSRVGATYEQNAGTKVAVFTIWSRTLLKPSP